MDNNNADLRDALRRVSPPSTPLSEGFTERLMEKTHSPLSRQGESLADARTLREATPLHHGRGARRAGWVFYRKTAAIFFAAAFLGGLVWASIRILAPHSSPKGVVPPSGNESGAVVGAASPVRFSDIRLDSILTVVSAHYGKAVCFRDTTTSSLRLNMVWDSSDSLAVFIETLNEFDRLHLCDERDTIFVTAAPLPKPHPLTPSPKGEGEARLASGGE